MWNLLDDSAYRAAGERPPPRSPKRPTDRAIADIEALIADSAEAER